MLNLNIPAIDLKASIEGVWCDFDKDISFLIGRNGSDAYTNAVKVAYKKNEQLINSGALSDEDDDMQLVVILSEHILLGWRGLKNGKDEIVYSKEAAIELLSDKRYFELRKWVILQSRSLENYRAAEIKK